MTISQVFLEALFYSLINNRFFIYSTVLLFTFNKNRKVSFRIFLCLLAYEILTFVLNY